MGGIFEQKQVGNNGNERGVGLITWVLQDGPANTIAKFLALSWL